MDERVPPWYKEKRDLLIVGGIIGATVAVVAAYGFSNLREMTDTIIQSQYYFPWKSWRQSFLYQTGLADYASKGFWPVLLSYVIVMICVSLKNYWKLALATSILLHLCFSLFVSYEIKIQHPITISFNDIVEYAIIMTGISWVFGFQYIAILTGLIFGVRHNFGGKRSIK